MEPNDHHDAEHDENVLGWTPECFDPLAERAVFWRKLPHWSQAGALCFITFRTWDSMPTAVVRRWQDERADWLRRQGIDTSQANWENLLRDWPIAMQREFRRFVADRWNDHLDGLHGECVFRQSEYAEIVAKSLLHADQQQYYLSDYVVMPNHVHLLAAFASEEEMLAQCESWKHYTATKINRKFGRKGRFWTKDAFDHLVRSPEQFERLRDYIAANPIKASLRAGEYLHYRRK